MTGFRRTLGLAAIVLLGFGAVAFAQAPSSQGQPSPTRPPPAAAPAASVPAPKTARVDCRAEAQSKGLRGPDMRDFIAICVAERRLACVKEAVERKIAGKERREFVRSCAARPGASSGNAGADDSDDAPPAAARPRQQ